MADTIVIDCSVAAKWILPEAGREPALRWFDRYAAGGVLLIAPDLLLAEFASLLAKRARRKQISAGRAHEAFSLMTKTAPRLYDTRSRIFRALDLSLRHSLSLWDSVYVALALEHDCPLVTADERLFRSGKPRHPSLRLLQEP
jgi:predicted nucleic acid-binding protein